MTIVELIPKIVEFTIVFKALSPIEIDLLLLNKRAPPLAALIKPSVTINAGILPLSIKTPLIKPNKIPNSKLIKIEITRGFPDEIRVASNIPQKATIEPTDKSIPPIIITNVIPRLTTPIMEF